MDEQFEYLFRASAGWAQARLTLSDDQALIEYDSASMGEVPVRYELQCEHKKFTDFHGALIMISLEQYSPHPNEFGGHVLADDKEAVDIGRLISPDEEDEERLAILNRLVIEYIRLPESQIRLQPPGGMWGIHDWTSTFSIVLIIHDAGFWRDGGETFVKTPLGRALERLDKLPLAVANGKYSLDS